MTQNRPTFADDLARLMNDAAELAGGVKREAETMLRLRAERLASQLDLVSRDEFEAVREMAIRAREENERLETRLEALEKKLAGE